MKHFKLMKFAFLFMLVTVFTSCEKEEANEPATIESQIIGLWTGSEFYEDGQLSEFNDFFLISTMEFKADGTGTSTSPFGAQPLTWSYDETNKKLRIETEAIDLGDGISIEASIIEGAEITKIDGSNLWYSYSDEGVTIEERYTK